MKRIDWYLLMAAALLVFAVMNFHNFYAIFWRADGAMVWPNNCTSESCVVRGTMRYIPFGGGAIKVQSADGAVTIFEAGSFRMAKLLEKQ